MAATYLQDEAKDFRSGIDVDLRTFHASFLTVYDAFPSIDQFRIEP
jgi:hypothetical protein